MNDERMDKPLQQDAVSQGHTDHPSLRDDMDDGLRFLHFMGMQTKHDVADLGTRLFALLEELIANGWLDMRRYDERRMRLWEQEESRTQERAHVQVADSVDKYKIENLPQIDCQSRLSLCKARCCKLSFPLSFQDLDERVIQWDYGVPYQIRKKPDGYCVHNESGSGRCGVYGNRPAICRTYDCRNDKRIWIDFEKCIIAPDDNVQATPPADAF